MGRIYRQPDGEGMPVWLKGNWAQLESDLTIDNTVHTEYKGEIWLLSSKTDHRHGKTSKIQVPKKLSLPNLHITLTLKLTEY